jgi:hypothetical protein
MRGCQIVAAILALTVGHAQAADVSVYSNTLVGGRPDVVDGQVKTVAPLYQLVGVRAKNIEVRGFDEFGVAVDAWGGLTLPNSPQGIAAGDVNLALVEGKAFKKRLTLRIGRQFVVGGVARAMFFDGLYAEYRSQIGLGLSAFVGIPVDRRFANFISGDFVVGTRAFFAPTINTEVGASFINMLQRGALARQDAGLDLRWKPLRQLSVSGAFVWSIADARMAEFDIGPRWAPSDNVEVLLNYRRTAPDLFLSRSSIFTVFADTSRDDAGGNITWQATRALSLFADARALWINGELGMDASGRVQLRPFRSPATTLTAQYHRLQIPSNGYHQARIGARHTLPSGFGLSVDFETYVLDQPVRGQTLSFSGSATATYNISKSWFIGATLFAATTPTFESRYEAVAKLTWIFPNEGHL